MLTNSIEQQGINLQSINFPSCFFLTKGENAEETWIFRSREVLILYQFVLIKSFSLLVHQKYIYLSRPRDNQLVKNVTFNIIIIGFEKNLIYMFCYCNFSLSLTNHVLSCIKNIYFLIVITSKGTDICSPKKSNRYINVCLIDNITNFTLKVHQI